MSASKAAKTPSRLRRRVLQSILLVLLLVTPALWAFAKPLRLWAPSLHGMSCAGAVCVEDAEWLAEATALYDAALSRIDAFGTPLRKRPPMVFCSTDACYRGFGGGAERAITYPWVGSLIAPTSWVPQLRAARADSRAAGAAARPEWFREGMADAWSEPPPEDMPDAFVPSHDRFEAWYAQIDAHRLWAEAGEL